MKTCSIDGCESEHYARGWCGAHYQRFRKHGDPLGGGERYATPEEAFLARVAWDGEHLIWIGAVNGGGYGSLSVNGRMVKAHRYAWQRERGPIPDGMVLDHTCWERACCNVDHLRVATPQQNNAYLSGAHGDRKHDLPRGVYRRGRGYQAMVGHNGTRHHLGMFSTPEEASAAAQTKRALLFGEFAGGA